MKNKNNYGITILVGFGCFILGVLLLYGLINLCPSLFTNTISTIRKEVTVNENGIADGIDAVYDAVVTIENYQMSNLAGIGSGFVYDESGLILTNNHVVVNASSIKVVLANGKKVDATIVGCDEYADIAVVRIDSKDVINVAKIGSSEKSNLGDTVFAVGTPMSSEYAGTVTRGILSGKNRMVEVSTTTSNTADYIMNVMQTDAAINPGNSGGPLCNVSGEVIGINNMKIVQSSIEGIGFAIPIEDAIEWANKLASGEEIKRSYLGISMVDLQSVSAYALIKEGIQVNNNVTMGVVVISVVDGGAAQKAGIQKGDVIIKIANQDITKMSELKYYLYKHEPGEKVDFVVNRNGNEKTISVTLEANK